MGYVYDDAGAADAQGTSFLQATASAAAQHDDGAFGHTFRRRGQLNRVQRYESNTTTWAPTGAFEESLIGYNTTGSVIFRVTPRGHKSTFAYGDAFYNSVNRSNPSRPTFAYQTGATDPDGYKTSTWYNYDFGAATQTQTPKPNVKETDQPGPIVTYLYYSAGRTKKVANALNGGHTEWVYPSSQTFVETYSAVADDSVQNPSRRFYNATAYDGAGRVRGTASELPVEGATDRFTGQRILYDVMGRAEYQSNPTEMTTADGEWTPAGEDANGGPWRWTRQEYDWRGRPTVLTHPDGKQRWAEYDGCGCAGSEIVTLVDEGTFGGDNVLRRRKQKMHYDALGRAAKTEELNWNDTVYRTVTNEYTALDQVKSVVERVGSEGTSQTTSYEFDGYGRMWKTKTPQATEPTKYEYYPDGTTRKVTDGRGASATFTYNARGLVTLIDYAAPATITASTDLTFDYDGAGNRISMHDGVGSVVYEYDLLSRLKSEGRRFSAWTHSSPDGRYTLAYDYTVGGSLKSITDPFGARIDYEYNDVAGRLTRVSGTPHDNKTEYASEFKYRAWGAVKSLKYGDGHRMAIGFNERLNPAGYDMTDAAGARLMGADYQYHDDGRLRFVDDLKENRFDRRYEYDHVGRVTKAESGWRARQEATPAAGDKTRNGPYNHYYGYDEFDHLTSRTGHYWYRESGESYQATYVNNRNQRWGWNYDVDGRETRSETTGTAPPPGYTTTYVQDYRYDAAGLRVDAGKYDGDGLRVKPAEGDRYYLRSSVLDGRTVSEIYSETGYPQEPATPGNKARTFVYVGGEAIAEQIVTFLWGVRYPSVIFLRRDPAGTALYGAYGSSQHKAIDIQGIATEAPDYARLEWEQSYYNQRYGSYNYGANGGYSSGYGGGIPGNFGTGCTVDGISTPCDIANGLAASGAAAQCPNNYCGPVYNPNRDGQGRGGFQVLYLFHSGFSYQPLGPSTTPAGPPPTLKPQGSGGGGGRGSGNGGGATGDKNGGGGSGPSAPGGGDPEGEEPDTDVIIPVGFRQPQEVSKNFIILLDTLWKLVQENNRSGASNGVVLCMTYKESKAQAVKGKGRWFNPPTGAVNNAAQGSTSHRGLMQVSPQAAMHGGLGNGQGKGLTDDKLAAVNADYINNIWNPAANIRAGSGYLGYLIKQRGSLENALKYYRAGADPNMRTTAQNYANMILNCAKEVDAGNIVKGLETIYPAPK